MNGEASRQEPRRAAALPDMTQLGAVACFACLFLPWLNPIARGPSSSVEPWLFCALCAALACALLRAAALHPAVAVAAAGIATWGFVRTGITPDSMALAAACLLIYVTARVAAGVSKWPEFVQVTALAWLLAAAASTVIALFQYFGVADLLAGWASPSASSEAFGNLRQRNQFASLTVIGMASMFWLAPRSARLWPLVIGMAWLAVGNAATTSRTGLAQMIMLGALAAIWPAPRKRRLLLWFAGLAAYLVAAVALPWLLEMATGNTGNRLWERVAAVDSCSSRMVLWSNVLHLIAERPLQGWGWGELDYAHYVTLYAGPRFCDILDNAHNLPLHLAVELGVPAALLVCAGLAWAAIRSKPWREPAPARQMAWAVLAVIGVHSMLEYPLWYGPFQITLGWCVGLLAVRQSQPVQSDVPADAGRASGANGAGAASGAMLLLAACIGAACIYAEWDYRRVSQIYLPVPERAATYQDDPLPQIRRSWLYRNHARFAELTITPLTRDNAQWTFETASDMLHYSPEPRVIEKVIDSAVMLGRDQEALQHLVRFKAAFPEPHATWASTRALPPSPQR